MLLLLSSAFKYQRKLSEILTMELQFVEMYCNQLFVKLLKALSFRGIMY